MKSVKIKSLFYAMGCALLVGSTAAHASGTNTFSGRAIVAQVKLLGIINLKLVDTGPLPSKGGTLEASLAELDLLGISAELLEAKTSGSKSTAKSSAELADLDIELELPLLGDVLGLLPLDLLDLDASVIRADSKAQCVKGKAKVSGSSEIADLGVLGLEIEADGEPNQTIDVLGLVKVVINEQKKSVSGKKGAITVNALHITVGALGGLLPAVGGLPVVGGLLGGLPVVGGLLGGLLPGAVADIIISSAHSDINCA